MIDPMNQKEAFKKYLKSAAELTKGKSSWTTIGQWAENYNNNYAAGYSEHQKLWKQWEEQSKEAIKKNLEDPSFTLQMVRDMLKANERIKPFVEKWERARGIILDDNIKGVVESADMVLMRFKYIDIYPINADGSSCVPSEYLLDKEDREAKYISYVRMREFSSLDGKDKYISQLDTYDFIYVYRDRDGKLKVDFNYPQVLQPELVIDKAFSFIPTGKVMENIGANKMKAEFGFHSAEYSRGRTDTPSAFKVRKLCVNAELLAYLFKDSMTFEYKKTVQTPEDLRAELEKFDAYLSKIDTIRSTIQSVAEKWDKLAAEYQELNEKLIAAIRNVQDFAVASENKVKKTIEILGAADYIDTFEKDDSNY